MKDENARQSSKIIEFVTKIVKKVTFSYGKGKDFVIKYTKRKYHFFGKEVKNCNKQVKSYPLQSAGVLIYLHYRVGRLNGVIFRLVGLA